MHGGNAGRKPIHGRYSIAAIRERQNTRTLIRAMNLLVRG